MLNDMNIAAAMGAYHATHLDPSPQSLAVILRG